MDPELRHLVWHEETRSNPWIARYGTRSGPGCSLIAALLGAPILVFLAGVGPRSAGGGSIPTLGVLQMAIPLAAIALLALREDTAKQTLRTITLDRFVLRERNEHGNEQVVAASDIADFVVSDYHVEVVDREGKARLLIFTRAPGFVARRLRAALDRAREPSGYRD